MSWKDHKPTNWGFSMHCIWCHEPWPCPTVELAAEVIEDIVKCVRPTSPEPMDSNTSFERWQTRHNVAEEIEEMIPEGLR
ncbi:hypothetical protein ACFW2V_13755 [Streptomyces sp. NPDC058947]|uniref:hypothetical protein n=1 Tax=Streptomyces sp. NPDC058947 TaxID=3346675 RepID=UPI0036BFD9A1